MKTNQILRSKIFCKASVIPVFTMLFLLSMLGICFGQYSSTNNKVDRCKTIVAVGVVGVKNKKRNFNVDANTFAKQLSDSLNKGTKVSTIPVTDISNERDFKEKATSSSPDFLLSIDLQTDVDNHIVTNAFCGYGTGRTCQSPDYMYTVSYKLEEVGTNRIVAKTDKSITVKNINASIALGQIADLINLNVGNLVRKDSTATPSLDQLVRRHLCYSSFPTNPSSLIMKFNVKTKDKEVGYDYYIKGNLWRLDVRPINGKAFITGFNGEAIWTVNKEEGLNAVLIGGETDGRRNLNFLLGEFLSEASSENLKYEILKVNLIGKDTTNGKSCHVLEARTRGATFIKSYYDSETGALLKKVLLDSNKVSQQETIFEDYQNIGNGIMFPMSIKTESTNSKAEITFSEVNLNPNIEDRIFLRPSSKN